MSPSPSSAATPSSATNGDHGRATLVPLSWRTGGTDPSRERQEAERFPIRSHGRGWFQEETAAGQGRAAGTGWHHLQSIGLGCPKGCRDTLQTPHSQGTTSSITHRRGSTGASLPSPIN